MYTRTQYQLYFGQSTNKGGSVDKDTFALWLDAQLIANQIDGATIEFVIGYWKGQKEKTVRLTVIDERDILGILKHIGALYSKDFHQDCVMLTKQAIEVDFISAE